MKNSFGTSVIITLFGESHGPAVGAVLDGMAPGIPVSEEYIAERLRMRRPFGSISTARAEKDDFSILSGVFKGRTTGTPICIVIPNEDVDSGVYDRSRALARPGHADHTAFEKYHGYEDHRGGGHFSGRVTAALVAAGAIALSALREKGIGIGTHIARCGGVNDRAFLDMKEDIAALEKMTFAALDPEAGDEMRKAIAAAARDGDSVGGILETAVIGLPAGVGEPWFDALESVLAHMLFSVPGIKGVQFGGGFDLADARGSEYNDELFMDGGVVRTRTNNNGGVNGGISNGMPLVFRCAVKPTPSVFKTQSTVDLFKREDALLSLSGRHDPAIIHRVRAAADCAAALALCDALALRYGTDWLGGGRCAAD